MRHRIYKFWQKRGGRLYFSEDKSSVVQKTGKCQEKKLSTLPIILTKST